jgi:hypothetical protein
MHAPLAMLKFVVHSCGAQCAWMSMDCAQVFPYVHQTSCSERCPVAHERLHHRSVHAFDGCRELAAVPFSALVSGTVHHYDQQRLVEAPVVDFLVYAAQASICTCIRYKRCRM